MLTNFFRKTNRLVPQSPTLRFVSEWDHVMQFECLSLGSSHFLSIELALTNLVRQ